MSGYQKIGYRAYRRNGYSYGTGKEGYYYHLVVESHRLVDVEPKPSAEDNT